MNQKTAKNAINWDWKSWRRFYGPGSSAMMTPTKGMPFVDEIVNHLFADIWAARDCPCVTAVARDRRDGHVGPRRLDRKLR